VPNRFEAQGTTHDHFYTYRDGSSVAKPLPAVALDDHIQPISWQSEMIKGNTTYI
jgi:hypothetical protein